MRLLFIRHGDPDYVHDTITEKGHREARLLAETAKDLHLGDCYQSPLGRAQATAAYSLEKLSKTAVTLPWLEEFPPTVDISHSPDLQSCYPDTPENGQGFALRIPWDMLPSYLFTHPEYTATPDGWRASEVARHSDMIRTYDSAAGGLDSLLASYGYVRDGSGYRVEKSSQQTVTFFCHFGITCALLSHLWNMSPFVLWHHLALAPTSVTEVVSEERRQGVAWFRALRLGDLSHLALGGEPPSFACRFCETYENTEQPH